MRSTSHPGHFLGILPIPKELRISQPFFRHKVQPALLYTSSSSVCVRWGGGCYWGVSSSKHLRFLLHEQCGGSFFSFFFIMVPIGPPRDKKSRYLMTLAQHHHRGVCVWLMMSQSKPIIPHKARILLIASHQLQMPISSWTTTKHSWTQNSFFSSSHTPLHTLLCAYCNYNILLLLLLPHPHPSYSHQSIDIIIIHPLHTKRDHRLSC